MKTNTALVLLATAALAALAGCAGTSGNSSGGNSGSAGSGYRNGSGVEMFGTIDTSVRRVETK